MADEKEQEQTPDSDDGEQADAAASEQGSLTASSYDAEDVFENPEPWEPIETKMVLYSFAAAVFFLAIGSYLIHAYVLH